MPANNIDCANEHGRWIWVGLLTLLLGGMLRPPAFAAQAPEARTGTLLLKSSADAEPTEALRVFTAIRAQVTGNVARVHVTQQFTNPTADWVEGRYVFPLATGAAVDELLMHVGERTIRGEIQQRDKARAIYELARSEGRRASLVDQERPNMFTTSVANIAPQASVTVEIAYLETIPYRDARYSLILPLAITPRYTPSSAVQLTGPLMAEQRGDGAAGNTATPERVAGSPQQLSIDIELAPGFALQSVSSLHHPVAISQDGLARHVRLEGTQLAADRDFELVWTPLLVPDVQAAVFAERAGKEAYALLMLMPPAFTSGHDEGRELEFIIDTSGSMQGASIEQARAALQLGIDRLSAGDRFNIIRFSSDASSLFAVPQPVSPASRLLASRFIAALTADGGTEMRAPLEIAFAAPPAGTLLRQIVFITDGGVSNETDIVALIRARIGPGRLFTVGIGAAPNAYFLQEAAIAGRGSYTFIAQRELVRDRMEDLFRKLERPALVDLELQWPGSGLAELAADLPRDLYAGDPLVILARLPNLPQGMLTLAGRSGGGAWVHQLPIAPVGEQAGIAKLWAHERIAELSRQKSFGSNAARVEARILELALQHHLVSELTSLVAVDDTSMRPQWMAQRREQAPTSAPQGSYWARTTGFAATATAAPLLLVIGSAILAFGCLMAVAALLHHSRATKCSD